MSTLIPAPRVPLVDPRTGLVSREWLTFLMRTGSGSDTGEHLAPLVAALLLRVAELETEAAALEAKPSIDREARRLIGELQAELAARRPMVDTEVRTRIAELETELAASGRGDPFVRRKSLLP